MQRNMETLQRYLEERQANGLSLSTRKQDALALRTLDSFLGDKAYEDVSREDMTRFVNSLGAPA